MPARPRYRQKPLTRLVLALRVGALNIESGRFRRLMAKEAETIPKTLLEHGTGHKSDIARMARKRLLELESIPESEWAATQKFLRDCADALGARFEITSETRLGERRRRVA